jgi:hypothetical protein
VIWVSRVGADHLQQLVPAFGRERDVVAEERLRSSEHGRHRRAQLVRERGDEVALRRLEPAVAGQVAKRVDDAVRAADGHEREPELAAVHLDRQRHRARQLGLVGDRDLGGDLLPVREHLARLPADHIVAGAPGDELRRAVPEAQRAVRVDQDHAISDRLEHARRLLAGSGHRLGARPGRGLRLRLFVQARVAHRRRHQAD